LRKIAVRNVIAFVPGNAIQAFSQNGTTSFEEYRIGEEQSPLLLCAQTLVSRPDLLLSRQAHSPTLTMTMTMRAGRRAALGATLG
jgi:hypothetical protein